MSSIDYRKKGKKNTIKNSRNNTFVKEKEKDDKNTNIDFRDAKDLQDDYEYIIKCIQEDEIDQMLNLIISSDMKYFLIHNDLDYNIFRACIVFKKVDGINELIKAGYKFNTDTLLIELYDCLIFKKNLDKTKDLKPDNLLTEDEMNFIITYKEAFFDELSSSLCIVM